MFKLSRLYEAMDDAFNIRYYRMTKQKKAEKTYSNRNVLSPRFGRSLLVISILRLMNNRVERHQGLCFLLRLPSLFSQLVMELDDDDG
jgi:hypothetical protein